LKIQALLGCIFIAIGACGGSKSSVKNRPTPSTHVAVQADKDSDTDSVVDEGVEHHHDSDVPHPPPKDLPPSPVVNAAAVALQAEIAAFEKAKPIFVANCSRCHTKGAAKATAKSLSHFDMSTYPLQGHHASTIGETVAAVVGQRNKAATMPKDKKGSVQGADLAAVLTWTTAWQNADTAGAHGSSSGDHLE